MKFADDTVQTRLPSPLGELILSASSKGLSGLWFAQTHRHAPSAPSWPEVPVHARSDLLHAQAFLAHYFERDQDQSHAVYAGALDLSGGTTFQQSVWRALLQIAPGRVQSYSQIAERVGRPQAFRAVGAAIGRNPVSIIVPCHRVLGAHGKLTGYAGGLDRKQHLLRREGPWP